MNTKSKTNPDDPLTENQPFSFSSLNQSDISLLHEASLEIMVRTGMRFEDEEALDLFKKGGAKVVDGNRVLIRPHMVETALRSVPKNITIYDQLGNRAMSVGGYRSYFGTGSDCLYVYDIETGKRRRAVLDDIVTGTRLTNALPNMDFLMCLFLPEDVPTETCERHQMAIMLQESTKPIVYAGTGLDSTVFAIEMASAVAGGLENLQRYPFIVSYVNLVSTWVHNKESTQRLLYSAERNLPSIYAQGNARGITAPMTEAGALALSNAGHLAGLVLSQLKREGSPFLLPKPMGDTLELHTLAWQHCAPDPGSFGWDMAHHYGIPTFGMAGCSNAKIFDSQVGAEAALSLLTNLLGGGNLVHDCGFLESSMTVSFELLTLCDELIGWLKRYFRKLEINEDTLALDVIHEVSQDDGATLMEHSHTYNHLRDDWQPQLFDRGDFDSWTGKGATTLEHRANERVKKILKDYHPVEPLTPDVEKKLEEIIARQ